MLGILNCFVLVLQAPWIDFDDFWWKMTALLCSFRNWKNKNANTKMQFCTLKRLPKLLIPLECGISNLGSYNASDVEFMESAKWKFDMFNIREGVSMFVFAVPIFSNQPTSHTLTLIPTSYWYHWYQKNSQKKRWFSCFFDLKNRFFSAASRTIFSILDSRMIQTFTKS